MAKNLSVKASNNSLRIRTVLATLAVLAMVALTSTRNLGAQSPVDWVCFPTCTPGDSRFIGLGGIGTQTLTGADVFVAIAASSVSPTIPISIFDGDTKVGGRWDTGSTLSTLRYELYADPGGDLSGLSGTPLAVWRSGTTGVAAVDGAGNTISMPDNEWYDLPDPSTGSAPFLNRAAAQGCPTCPYRYILRTSVDVLSGGIAVFKVRSGGTVAVTRQMFSFYGARTSIDGPSVTATTYDGVWNFDFFVPPQTKAVTLFDGDLDFGNYDCTSFDTDDLDSPAYPTFVSAAQQGGNPVIAEGQTFNGPVMACGPTTGNPNDDFQSINFRRTIPLGVKALWSNAATSPDGQAHTLGGIAYIVTDPTGRQYVNDNPSGSVEWEQFRIDTAPFDPSLMDYHATPDADGFLPSGVWRLRVEGQDLGNLSAWRSAFEILGRDEKDKPTPRDAFYFVTGHVFEDMDQDGLREAGDPPFADVDVELLDSNGNVIDSALSGPQAGAFSFRVAAGTYGLRVVDSSGVVASYFATTPVVATGLTVGGEILSANADFGYTRESLPENTAPTAVDDYATTPYETPVTLSLTPGTVGQDSDPENDTLTVISIAPTTNGGTYVQSGNSILFTPYPGFTGAVTPFQYTIWDGNGGFASAFIHITVGPPPPPAEGRMTGGGSVFTAANDRVTHGFELHCNPNKLPNNLEVNWGPARQAQRFHLDKLTSVVCLNDPLIAPAPPDAGFDTYIGKGTGKYNGVPGATIEFTLTDASEPGRNDTATIVIKNSAGAVVLSVSGNVRMGNQQAHRQ